MKKFYALEPHVDGTTQYRLGDEREADENEVQHLVELGVLSTEKPKLSKAQAKAKADADAEAKAKEEADAKAEADALANKAEQPPANKGN